MKKTLLELTMDVLNATNGDEINSISDTVESLQIAQDIQNVYYDIIGRKDWQFLRKLRTLESVSDNNYPTHLIIPEVVSKIEYLKYNKKKEKTGGRNYYSEVYFMHPDEFLDYVNQRDNTADNYDTITDFNGAELIIRNDGQPTYWTSFDDKFIVMDAYDGDIEDTLQGNKTQLMAYDIPSFSITNEHIPELPAEMFPLLLSECITYALAKDADQLMQKTEQTSVRQQRHMSQTHGRAVVGVRYPNYGRTPRKSGSARRSAHFGPRS